MNVKCVNAYKCIQRNVPQYVQRKNIRVVGGTNCAIVTIRYENDFLVMYIKCTSNVYPVYAVVLKMSM
jgi:hypothetical protein